MDWVALLQNFGFAVVVAIGLAVWAKAFVADQLNKWSEREAEWRKDSDENRQFLIDEIKNSRLDAKDDRDKNRELEAKMAIAVENSNNIVASFQKTQENLSKTLESMGVTLNALVVRVEKLDTEVRNLTDRK